ncbi:MAG: SBBP repeat-containing protein [Bryobacteraceae bacterium]
MRFLLVLITTTLAIAGQFTTSIGDAYPFTVSAITTDSAGNTYVVGGRQLTTGTPYTFIANTGALPPVTTSSTLYAGSDIFVTKLDPNGNVLFTDTFAGKGVDTGTAIAVDPTGNIYIAGTTTSPDFPLSNAIQTQASSTNTGFIIKLSNDGAAILYSTYFGGVLGSTSITALATDAKGNLYLTGSTTSADFPNIGSALSQGSSGAIYASISAAGDKILYAGANFAGTTPSQGGFNTVGIGVAVDASGNAYFAYNDGAGSIYAPDGNLTKIDPSGKNILNANLGSYVSALAVDPAGNIYVGLGINGPVQASIEKFDPNLNDPWTNTLQSEATSVTSIAVDSAGNVWATGEASPGFPNANGWTTGPEFVVGINSTGSALTYSALYPTGTVAQSVALDPSGLVHVAGMNGFISAISPTAPPPTEIFAFQNAFGGNATARISPAEVIAIYGPGIGPATAVSATPVNGFYPTTLTGVQVTINGTNIPLLYVSANQINAVVQMGIGPNAAATVHVINGTAVSPDYPVWIAPSEAEALPTVINQDGSINSQANPAHSGSIVTFYATGWQSSFSPLTDGQVATTAQNACQLPAPVTAPTPPATGASGGKATGACQVTPTPGVYAPPATVLYGGAAPDIVAGVTQFNVQIGAVAESNFAFQFSFSITGPASVAQTVWIAY